MIYAELTLGEWGAIITAIGGAGGAVIGAIFAGLKYLRVEDNKVLLSIEKVKAATAKLEITKQTKDMSETIKVQAQTIKERSEEVHDLRNKAGEYALHSAVLKERCEIYEKRIAQLLQDLEETKERLRECEEDRSRLLESHNSKTQPPHK